MIAIAFGMLCLANGVLLASLCIALVEIDRLNKQLAKEQSAKEQSTKLLKEQTHKLLTIKSIIDENHL